MVLGLSAFSTWSPIPGGITAPEGFQASGIRAGLKPSENLDLALLLAPGGAVCGGIFTKSIIRAACIDLCIERLQLIKGSQRAVLINSGQANACTGNRGRIDSLKATKAVADNLGLRSEEILICSTGVIGVPIPIDSLLRSVNPLAQHLSESGGSSAAEAILTTDLVTKEISYEANLGGRIVRIGGMAKGSGMIHPDMATMLAFLSCDAAIPQSIWQMMIQKSADCSFNCISVDGDTSTNDSFLAFSAGEPLDQNYWDQLQLGLNLVTQYLAKAIARDGEGASCLIEVKVEGTLNEFDARKIARTISSSSLVKTAIHGCDPNWGRIIAAAGRSGVDFEPQNISLSLGPYKLIQNGEPIAFDRKILSEYIKHQKESKPSLEDSVEINLKVGNGCGKGLAWGCDLSSEYIHINADYTT